MPSCMQGMLHPLELMSLVVGQQVIEWTELEKVHVYTCTHVYTHVHCTCTLCHNVHVHACTCVHFFFFMYSMYILVHVHVSRDRLLVWLRHDSFSCTCVLPVMSISCTCVWIECTCTCVCVCGCVHMYSCAVHGLQEWLPQGASSDKAVLDCVLWTTSGGQEEIPRWDYVYIVHTHMLFMCTMKSTKMQNPRR